MIKYYILFENHEQAMKMRRELSGAGIRTVISPTPRQASLCCGVSLMADEEQIEAVRSFAASNACVFKSIVGIEQDFDPRRDRYL